MKDYEAEGGVVTETTRPDGTVEQHMEMKQTVTSEVSFSIFSFSITIPYMCKH